MRLDLHSAKFDLRIASCETSSQIGFWSKIEGLRVERLMRMISAIAALSLLLSGLTLDTTLPEANAQTTTVKCVKRETGSSPPDTSIPPRGAIGSAPEISPVCPPGEVPIVPPSNGHFPKGNPLLGSSSSATQGAEGESKTKNLRPFDQVYWKREKSTAKTASQATKNSSHTQ